MSVIIVSGTFAGLLIAALSLPLMWRKVPRNQLYGLRVRATFEDESVWYDANAATGRDLLIVGVLIVAATLLPSALGFDERAVALTVTVVTIVGVVWAAVIGWRRANRMLEARRSDTPRQRVP